MPYGLQQMLNEVQCTAMKINQKLIRKEISVWGLTKVAGL